MNQPLISILIPVYNVEKYIEKCLSSLFENKHAKDCEFVITNDYSKDNSMEIVNNVLNKYPQIKNVKIINHDKNRGLAAARNTGLQNSTGKYILNVDSDDYVENNYIDEFYNLVYEEDYDIIGCSFISEYQDKSINEPQKLELQYINLINELITCKIKNALWCKMFKRDIIINNNIQWIEGIDMYEDLVFDIQYFPFIKKVYNIDKYLYHYTIRSNSISHKIINEKKLQNTIFAFDFVEKSLIKSFGNDFFDKTFKKNLYLRLIDLKFYNIIIGPKYIQSKYYNIFPQCSSQISNCSFGKITKKILLKTSNNKYPKILFFINSILLIKRGFISLHEYFNKNINR